MGETEAPPARVGSRESRRDSLCPRLVGVLGIPTQECLYWGGSGQGTLAVLLGVRAQALWLAGEVLGGTGPPQLPAPPMLVGASPAHEPRAPTGLHSVGTSPELMDRGQQPQYPAPALTGASWGSMSSALLGQPPKMT